MSLLPVVFVLAVVIVALIAWIFYASHTEQRTIVMIEKYVEQILIATARVMSPEEISNVNSALAGRVYPEVIIVECEEGVVGQMDPVRIGTKEQFQNAMENRIIYERKMYAVHLSNDLYLASAYPDTRDHFRTVLRPEGKPVHNATIIAEGYFDTIGTFFRTTQYHPT